MPWYARWHSPILHLPYKLPVPGVSLRNRVWGGSNTIPPPGDCMSDSFCAAGLAAGGGGRVAGADGCHRGASLPQAQRSRHGGRPHAACAGHRAAAGPHGLPRDLCLLRGTPPAPIFLCTRKRTCTSTSPGIPDMTRGKHAWRTWGDSEQGHEDAPSQLSAAGLGLGVMVRSDGGGRWRGTGRTSGTATA